MVRSWISRWKYVHWPSCLLDQGFSSHVHLPLLEERSRFIKLLGRSSPPGSDESHIKTAPAFCPLICIIKQIFIFCLVIPLIFIKGGNATYTVVTLLCCCGWGFLLAFFFFFFIQKKKTTPISPTQSMTSETGKVENGL